MESEIMRLLESKGYTLGYEVVFPNYDKLPKDIELALAVLQSRGMKIRILIEPKKEKAK